MDPMLEAFLAESRENLEAAGQSFLRLESAPDDAALMDDIFRAVHTIKGSSGLFDVAPLTTLVHAAEDVLDAVRAGGIALTSEHVDLFLDAMDRVSAWLDELDTQGTLAEDAPHAGVELTQALRALLPESTQELPQLAPVQTNEAPAWWDPELMPAGHGHAIAVTYRPDAQCFFAGDDPVHNARTLPGLTHLALNPLKPWPAAVEMDPYACNLEIHLVTQAERSAVEHHFRYMPDQVQIARVERGATPGLTAAAHAMIKAQHRMLGLACPDSQRDGRMQSAYRIARAAFATLHRDTNPLDAAITTSNLEALRAAMLFDSEPTPATVESDAAPQGDGLVVRNNVAQPSAGKGEKQESQAAKVLKVDQARIDQLMDLVGELVVAKNALPYLARRAEDDYHSRPMRKEIEAQYAVIDRLSGSLQNAMMAVRMVPMSSIFQRFPRLVRDLSRKLEKTINLELEGETTEADKNVIEELADPLIHLVRNSLDHGLETPAEREAAGKPGTGTLWLRAIPQDDQVIIEVQDDGRGINPDTIKRKAYEKGLIDEERLETISDHEAIQLIFAPGFSTAEAVSDLSGRGVGMDVVRTVVERAGGSVVVSSELGQGSTVRLALPLSMAINRVMVVNAADQPYGIAMEYVRETVKISQDEIQQVKQHRVLVRRDRLIPLQSLRGLLGLPDAAPSAEVTVLVMRIGDTDVGLIVDQFQGGIDIIQKPLDGVLSNYPYYAGTALLGDGRVLLVLNTKELLACQ